MHGEFRIEGDVSSALDEKGIDDPTPQEAAEAAWDEICHWVHTGYRPVIAVNIRGVDHEVDLDEES